MFKLPKRSLTKTELEVARTKALTELSGYVADSEEYKKIMKHVKTLSDLIDAEKHEKLSPNTVAVILGNLGVAGIIIWFEREHPLSTKVFPFLAKPKS